MFLGSTHVTAKLGTFEVVVAYVYTKCCKPARDHSYVAIFDVIVRAELLGEFSTA